MSSFLLAALVVGLVAKLRHCVFPGQPTIWCRHPQLFFGSVAPSYIFPVSLGKVVLFFWFLICLPGWPKLRYRLYNRSK
jgi:hypothetical protein